MGFITAITLASAIGAALGLLNDVADKPAMGWNTYNAYNCYPNESTYRSNTKALVDMGLADLGYVYSTIDCGWTVKDRTSDGKLTWNETLFPSGFPKLGEWVHGLGLKFGVYEDAGIKLCGSPPEGMAGSLYHEKVDAETFAEWGADSLKYDNCFSDADTGFPNQNYAPAKSPETRMANMSLYIESQDRPILFQICEWGIDFPARWAPWLGHSWRIGNDIIPHWRAISRTINQAAPNAQFTGPGQWMDLDMLEIGTNVLNKAEEQTHFTMWAILKSPLTIGGTLKDESGQINEDSLEVLKNIDVIGYNQDDLGIAASFKRRWTEDEYELWSGPLSNGRTVAALINWSDESRELMLDLPDVGLQYAKTVKNVWSNTSASDVHTSYSGKVEGHGVLLLELADTVKAGTYTSDIFAKKSSGLSVFNPVYAAGTSDGYTLEIDFTQPPKSNVSATVKTSSGKGTKVNVPAGALRVQTHISLKAGNNNTIEIQADTVSVKSINVIAPPGTYYPHTAFNLTGGATVEKCDQNYCLPVGSKASHIGANGSVSANIEVKSAGAKYVKLDYINNDIALATAFDWGTNTRNMTITVNDQQLVRLEVPLTGKTSELFGPGKGWWDSNTIPILLDGWNEGSNKLAIANAGGDDGYSPWAPDFVGLRVLD